MAAAASKTLVQEQIQSPGSKQDAPESNKASYPLLETRQG